MTSPNSTQHDSWHDSLPFTIPRRHRKQQRNMQQSTIYKRHVARHEKYAQLRDDPRGKVVRVLSLLPGMNLLVAPYDPKVHGSKSEQQKNQQPMSYFDSLVADANIISFGPTTTATATSPTPNLSFMSSALVTGVSALTAHTLWSKPSRTSSPFVRSSTVCSTTPSIVLTGTGDLRLLRSIPALKQQAVPSVLPFAALSTTMALGLPFIVRSQLEPGVMANAVAGLVGGCLVTATQGLSTTNMTRNILTARPSVSPVAHVALAVASLSLYDTATPHGTLATGLAGGASGAFTAMVTQSGSVPRQSMMHATFFILYRSLSQLVLPPTHA